MCSTVLSRAAVDDAEPPSPLEFGFHFRLTLLLIEFLDVFKNIRPLNFLKNTQRRTNLLQTELRQSRA
jgi:hypothetical protein